MSTQYVADWEWKQTYPGHVAGQAQAPAAALLFCSFAKWRPRLQQSPLSVPAITESLGDHEADVFLRNDTELFERQRTECLFCAPAECGHLNTGINTEC